MAVGLPYQPHNFCMSRLSVDNNLRIGMGCVLGFDTTLKVQHHRTGGIDDLKIVMVGDVVGLRRFTMSAQQYLGIMQMVKV